MITSFVPGDAGQVEARGRLAPAWAVAWFTYLLLGPFYLFPSGLPQISDFIAATLAAAVLLRLGWRTLQPFWAVVVFLAAFVFYVGLVSFGWGVATGQLSIMSKPIYYLFNLLIMLTFLVLYSRAGEEFLRLTLWGVSLSVGVQVVLALTVFSSQEGLRQSLLFNNPNQLGYYSLIAIAVVAVISHHLKVAVVHQALFFLGALYLVVLSLSKAALLSAVILCLLLFIRRPLLGLVLVAASLTWLYQVPAGQEMLADLQQRFESVGVQGDDNWAGRGYDRIVHHPDLLILGAGEGGYSRFTSQISGSEMHSTWGTILFSYGLPGTAIFLLFLGLVFWHSGLAGLLYFLPVAMYGLTHNGIRFTMLWILLAVILCVAHRAQAKRAEVLVPEYSPPLSRMAYVPASLTSSLSAPKTSEVRKGPADDAHGR